MEREDLKWKQKSRELWIKEGDRNTKFFHLSTLVRRRRNLITEIREENGLRLMNRKDIGEYFSSKFSKVFHSSCPNVPPNLDGLIEPCIFAQENNMLIIVPSAEDIKRVVFEMHPVKAPRPDGMPGLFYRHYWSIVGEQLVAAVQSFFREGWLLRELNHTYPQSSRCS